MCQDDTLSMAPLGTPYSPLEEWQSPYSSELSPLSSTEDVNGCDLHICSSDNYDSDDHDPEPGWELQVASQADDSADDHDPEPVADAPDDHDPEPVANENICGLGFSPISWVRASAAQCPNWGHADFFGGSDGMYFWSSDEEGLQPGPVSSDTIFRFLCRSTVDR